MAKHCISFKSLAKLISSQNNPIIRNKKIENISNGAIYKFSTFLEHYVFHHPDKILLRKEIGDEIKYRHLFSDANVVFGICKK
jgi:hypothetical protein